MIISYQEALSTCLAAVAGKSLGTENIPLADSGGRSFAGNLQAPLSIQPFDNAAMDGYALRHGDVQNARYDSPLHLLITGTIAAGDPVSCHEVKPGTCMKIMTGAPLPPGADAIVPFEFAKDRDGHGVFTQGAALGDHVRKAGEDFMLGDPVLSAGALITAAHILPLATLGISHLSVFKRPRVAFLATGRELVDDLEKPLASGEIYNSNRPYALAMLAAMGAHVVHAQTISDDIGAFEEAITSCLGKKVDLVVSSGAVSAGDFDFVRRVLEARGADILYHTVKMKPGKPNLLARLPDRTLYFGLPGNPVATAVGLRFFVRPTLEKLLGRKSNAPIRAHAVNAFSKKPGLQMFLKGFWEVDAEGVARVTFLEGQASFMVHPFLRMNCWIDLPEDGGDVHSGDRVMLHPA